ncbi:MAG: DUF4268 domain-containing protein, partial [Oscillospiraceae bacterium]
LKAVELLEVLKVFLDIPNCVYVLACDYHVITMGLKEKLGASVDELKGKSFFDKIIQLPFSMPLGLYDARKYIKHLLDKIKLEYNDNDLDIYSEMVNYSVRFNPRSLKRLFNSMLLLKLVAENKGLFDINDNTASKQEKLRIIFGVLCLQMAYEPVYNYLLKNCQSITSEFFEIFSDELNGEAYDNLIADDIDFKNALIDISNVDGALQERLKRFFTILGQGIQLDSDGNGEVITESEMENFKAILSFSSVTSTVETPQIQKVSPRGEEYSMLWTELNGRIQNAIENPKFAKLGTYPSTEIFFSKKKSVYFQWAFRGRPRSSFCCELHFEWNSLPEESKSIFRKIVHRKDELEQKLGQPLIIQEEWRKNISRIYIELNEGQITEPLKDWAIGKMVILYETLVPQLKESGF